MVTPPSAPEARVGPAVAAPAAAAPNRRRTGRLVRLLGTVLLVAGVAAVAWTIVVWQWQDPFTALYTTYQQHKLSGQYTKIAATYQPVVAQHRFSPASPRVDVRAERKAVASDAAHYRRTVQTGHALGRLKVPRLGLNIVLVTGTDHDSLTKGPGWDERTFLPGAGKLIYIAGHRTTYLAPFAHIDSLRPGDLVTIEVPYGTFVYRVRKHVIVPSDDLAQLNPGTREVVKLQACHPRFFATHRYIVYAYPVRVIPKGAKPYTVKT
jgi:sortase A